jgi:peptide chain release factor 1
MIPSITRHASPCLILRRRCFAQRNPAIQRRGILSDAIQNRVAALCQRHDEINALMNSGEGSSLGKEFGMLIPVARLRDRLEAFDEEEKSFKDLLDEALTTADRQLELECTEELRQLEERRAQVEKRVLDAILPKDEDDYGSDCIIEIRAGIGGDEAALFSSEILEAYANSAKVLGFKLEILDQTKTELGGVKEASFVVSSSGTSRFYGDDADDDSSTNLLAGFGPYGFFKFESGVHRVQRVPVNDVKLQTSACSVAVLPSEPEDSSKGELLPSSELKIETMRSQGAGGQSVNTTDSAVRITHIPTGITAAIQDERSQHKNKDKALKLIAARVRDHYRGAAMMARGEERKSLMGGGDRSERIRTYNYPQDRVTDHRCKHSESGIVKLFQGTSADNLVGAFAPLMRVMHRDELIREMEEKDRP